MRPSRKEYAAAYYKRNREKMLADGAVWRVKNREGNRRYQNAIYATIEGRARRLVSSAKSRAKDAGLPFSISYTDIVPALSSGVCEATGLLFAWQSGCRGTSRHGPSDPFSPSIDRLDARKGYVQGNIQVVLWGLNAMRGCWGDAVLLQIAEALKVKNTRLLPS